MKTTPFWIGILAFATLLTTGPSGSHAQSARKGPAPSASERGAASERGREGGQTSQTREGTAGSSKDSGPASADVDAQREQIWNSPEMLTARAWMETYFERSAKISDEQAKKYMDGLKTMYPDQMKLWLVKFQADRESSKQQVETQRQARHQSISMRQDSQQVGGFQNPYAGRRATSSGQPIGNVRQTYGGANPIAQHQPTQKPFAGQSVRRPIVTSEDFARREILGGLGWGW